MKNKIINLVEKHNIYRDNSINLLPSENILSDKVKIILGSDLASRYSLSMNSEVHGIKVKNAYGGTKYFDSILEYGEKIAKFIFNTKYAEIRPLSGHISAMIALLSTTKKNGKIMAIDPEFGGYDGYSSNYLPDILSLNYAKIPFDQKNWNIDYEKFEESVKKFRPNTVILGASYILFPYNLKLINEISEKFSFTLIYDASHVMGLVAGKNFQSDIFDRTDLVFGSTHKSFFGPQGGILLTNNDEIFSNIEKNIVWRTMDNYHLNRVAALAQAMEEMKRHAENYSKKVIENSETLARVLDEMNFGIKSFNGKYTNSHQIFIKNPEVCKKLERSRLIIDCVGRMGTNEISRLGFGKKDINKLADLIIQSLKKNVSEEVISFRKRFKIHYL
ncbi:MAG: aminotransferase class I/II-fold pyridoxal phosphate-dependent enzyme [Thermoplasmata archaeon]|nr:aminotransferase class I/II-fold pyridoxal phosphate-dependent enzyme [Thermoplasmata archaeon]